MITSHMLDIGLISVLFSPQRPLSALTWGHNDQRLFVACGSILHVAWVEKGVAPLQVLCREVIVGLVSDEKNVNKLPLPGRLKTYVTERSSVTIKVGLLRVDRGKLGDMD